MFNKKFSFLITLTLISICLPIQAMETEENPTTPLRPKRPLSPRAYKTPSPPKRIAVEPSPWKIKQETPNHCRKIIKYLQQNLPDLALKELVICYRKIPQSFMHPKWRIEPESKEIVSYKFYKNINIATAYIIFLCLLQSNTSNFETLKPENLKIIKHNTNNVYQVQLKIGKYLIIFTINENNEPSFTIIEDHEIPVKIDEYITNNFIKQTLLQLLNLSTIDHDPLGRNLTKILQKLHPRFHESKEQFYHTLIFAIFIFMGSNFSLAEAYTGEGRADLVFRSRDGNGIIEFKLNPREEEAGLSQIQEKKYMHCFEPGKVKFLGINIHTDVNPQQYVRLTRIDILHQIFTYQQPQIQRTSNGFTVKL